MGQNRCQWRKRRIERTGTLLHRVVWKTTLNEKYGGTGILHENVPHLIHLELSQNQQMKCQSIIKFDSFLCRQIPKKISLQLVVSTQFSSDTTSTQYLLADRCCLRRNYDYRHSYMSQEC